MGLLVLLAPFLPLDAVHSHLFCSPNRSQDKATKMYFSFPNCNPILPQYEWVATFFRICRYSCSNSPASAARFACYKAKFFCATHLVNPPNSRLVIGLCLSGRPLQNCFRRHWTEQVQSLSHLPGCQALATKAVIVHMELAELYNSMQEHWGQY